MSPFSAKSLLFMVFVCLIKAVSSAQCTAVVVSTSAGSHCGAGVVTLSGHGSAGTTMIWYDSQTGGTIVGYGDTITTPSLASTTTYYAAATTGSSAHAGAASPGDGTGWGSTNLNSYMIFNVAQPLVLRSVTVYPTADGSITVGLQNSAGTILQQATFPLTLANGNYSYVPLGGGSNTTIGSGVVLPVNFSIAAGTGYRLVQLDYNSTIVRNTGGVAHTFYNTNNNGLTITGNWIGSSGSSMSYWYNFYDWVVATGDTAQCESARVPVTAAIRALPAVSAGADQVVCAGTGVTLGTGNSADTYVWSTGATSATITATTAGSYWVRGTNTATGCSLADTAVISTVAQPAVGSISASFSSPAYTLSGTNVQNATGYLWDFGDGATSTDPTPQHTYSAAGNYSVYLCVTNQCYTSCTGLTAAANTQYVSGTLHVTVAGLDEVTKEMLSLKVYPQPTADILHIAVASGLTIQAATIYDLMGKAMMTSSPYSNVASASVASLADGIYLLEVGTDHGTAVVRISVSHQ